MLRDARIGVYKVGGRDGHPSLSLPAPLGDDVFDVFFEADETAIAQMEERNDPARSRIFPYCLADRNGPGTLYLNYDPFTSSLLKPNRAFAWTNWFLHKDYPHTEAMRVMREVPVELHTLDSLDLLADGAVAPPTLMCLDTQGSELDILKGARELLREHTVGVVTEAEFVPFYENQPLFGDLCSWLDAQGFLFAAFTDGPHNVEPFRVPVGHRGRPMVGYCDALFLRRVETLTRPEHFVQLAFIALLHEQLPYAFHCLDYIVTSGMAAQAHAVPNAYARFVFDIARAREEMPVLYPPTFVDLFPTYEESTDRFGTSVTHEEFDRRIVERYTVVQRRFVDQMSTLTLLAGLDDLPLERVYRAYGLVEHADSIKLRRIKDVTEMLAEFSITINRGGAPQVS